MPSESKSQRDVRIAPIGLEQEDIQKSDAYKSASDALKTRICYVSQVVIFLIASVDSRKPKACLKTQKWSFCLRRPSIFENPKPGLEQAPPGHIHTRKADSYARGHERSGLKGRGCAPHVPNAEERHQCTPQRRTKGLDPQQCLSQIGYG